MFLIKQVNSFFFFFLMCIIYNCGLLNKVSKDDHDGFLSKMPCPPTTLFGWSHVIWTILWYYIPKRNN